jgi:hypothetical protein
MTAVEMVQNRQVVQNTQVVQNVQVVQNTLWLGMPVILVH